jgi:hypothetical protein
MPLPFRSSPGSGAFSAQPLRMNGDERLFGSLVLGHVVPENRRQIDCRLRSVVVTGGTPVGRGVERRKALRVIPATTLCDGAPDRHPTSRGVRVTLIPQHQIAVSGGLGQPPLPSMSGIWGNSENIYSL